MKKITLLFALILNMASYAQTPGGGLIDIDGNVYNTVIIGTQEWTQTNFTVSKFTDGTPIPEHINPQQGGQNNIALYNNYYSAANGVIYGKLYNWYAIAGVYNNASLNDTSLRKQFAPPGWHVPTTDEWNTLITFLGGSSVAGGKMKEVGTTLWSNPNTGATNDSGFTGLPGGEWSTGGAGFQFKGLRGTWWSSCQTINGSFINNTNNWMPTLRYTLSSIDQPSGMSASSKFSVRLIKDSDLNNHTFFGDNFKIYPNPAKDQITIDCGDVTNMIGLRYKIINTIGQEIIEGNIISYQHSVPLNQLKGQGIYFVKIVNEQNEVLSIKKIIVQ